MKKIIISLLEKSLTGMYLVSSFNLPNTKESLKELSKLSKKFID